MPCGSNASSHKLTVDFKPRRRACENPPRLLGVVRPPPCEVLSGDARLGRSKSDCEDSREDPGDALIPSHALSDDSVDAAGESGGGRDRRRPAEFLFWKIGSASARAERYE